MEYQPFAPTRRLFEPVALDTEGFRTAVDKASSKYWQNRTAVDAIEIQMNNLDIDEKYEPIRQTLLDEHRKKFSEIVAGDGFLNGSGEVAKMVKGFLNNAQIKAATRNTADLAKWKKELRDGVDAGRYDAEDYDDMVQRISLPDIGQEVGEGVYNRFQPDYAPQRFDLSEIMAQALANYHPDSHSSTRTNLEKVGIDQTTGKIGSYAPSTIAKDGTYVPSIDMADGTKIPITVGKRTRGYSTTNGNEIVDIMNNILSSNPQALQYVRHKVAIDRNKANNYAEPIDWRSVDPNDKAVYDKLLALKESALMKVNQTSTINNYDDVDGLDDFMMKARNGGNNYFPETSYTMTGRTAASQFDGTVPVQDEAEKAVGNWFQDGKHVAGAYVSGFLHNLYNIFNGPENRQNISKNMAQLESSKTVGYLTAKAILNGFGVKVNSVEDLKTPENKQKLETYFRTQTQAVSAAVQNIAFRPFAMNQQDPNVEVMMKDSKADVLAYPDAHQYVRVKDNEKMDPNDIFSRDGKDEVIPVGDLNTFHHLTQTAGPEFFAPIIHNINGVEYYVNHHEGYNKSVQGRIARMTGMLYSKAELLSTPQLTKNIEIPTFISMQNGIPTEVGPDDDGAVKFTSAKVDFKDPRTKEVRRVMKYTVYSKTGEVKSVMFDPANPRYTEKFYNFGGKPQRVPVEAAFLFESFQ